MIVNHAIYRMRLQEQFHLMYQSIVSPNEFTGLSVRPASWAVIMFLMLSTPKKVVHDTEYKVNMTNRDNWD